MSFRVSCEIYHRRRSIIALVQLLRFIVILDMDDVIHLIEWFIQNEFHFEHFIPKMTFYSNESSEKESIMHFNFT